MSYGVIASKSAKLMVQVAGSGGSDSDAACERFRGVWSAEWVPGRVTLTRLHLNFVPARAGRGIAMLDVALRDVVAVEVSPGRMGAKVLGVRTQAHLVQIRMSGAETVAAEITKVIDEAHARGRKVRRS